MGEADTPGDTFSGYESTDGATWVLVGRETIMMAGDVYVGLAVASHNNSAPCAATLDNIKINAW